MNKIQVLDLFSGIGGFSLGLERAGFETVAFCEIDKYCRLVLQKHWKDIKIYSDVREIKKERLEAHGIPSPDVITGGFPCQPFSVAGRQKGSRDNRYLWPEMFRIIKEFKPLWIIAENVRGIINIQDGVVFEGVHADLESQNYETQTFIIPAAGVGAPHRRDRVWVVANSRRTIRGEQSSRNKESIGSGTSQETKRSADSDSIARSSEREKIMADSSSIQSREPSESKGREDSSRGSIDSRGNKNKRTEVMANSTESRSFSKSVRNSKGMEKESQRKKERGNQFAIRTKTRSSNVANSKRVYVQGQHDGSGKEQSRRGGWWEVEPNVGRVADGLPGRVHRLKGLGNSIVPQIAEEIGKAILKVDLIDRDSKA